MPDAQAPTPVAPPRDENALAFARNRRRERTRTGLAAIASLLGILYALAFAVGRSGDDRDAAGAASARIELLPAADTGGAPLGAGATPVSVAGAINITTIEGSAPNLYGGSRTPRCGLPSEARLTEVILQRDTRVTAFRGGVAPVQAVLQAGSAILVDDYGVPRVRCGGVIPLGPARPVTSSPTYTGAAWAGFDPAALTVVVAAGRVDTFTLVNLDGPGTEPIRRRSGERP